MATALELVTARIWELTELIGKAERDINSQDQLGLLRARLREAVLIRNMIEGA